MARALWSGSVSFGLVNIPVKLYSAVSQREVRFNMLHDADGARIQLRRFCSAENVEVAYEHIVKGYEVARGRYVTVTPEELESADPVGAKTIAIEDFVELVEVDPVHLDATYHLGPDKGAEKPYALLLATLRATGKVGIARFVLRSRESLCCLRPSGPGLSLTTMNWADELVPIEELGLPASPPPSERELALARQLVESLSVPFEAGRYRDTHREKLVALLERKGAGEEVVAAPAPAMAEVVNLADALAASLAASRRERKGEGDGAGGGRAASARAANAGPNAPANTAADADAPTGSEGEAAGPAPRLRGSRSAPRPRQAARTVRRRAT